jgi:hypothetical protein
VRPAGPGRDPRITALLERTEAMQLSAAARLRAMGWEDLARRAEQFAAWARFDLDEPQAARRLYAVAGELRGLTRPRLLYGKTLAGALSLAGAGRGNLQLVDQETGSLVIVAEHGFGPEFLEYFAVVNDDRSACGRAAKRRAQTVISDVMTDPGFAAHRAIAAAAGFRAVMATPLTDRDGRLIGMVSTHYRRPYSPPPRDRQVLRRYGELAGQMLAGQLAGPSGRWPGRRPGRPPGGASGALRRAALAHDQAAAAHERSARAGVGDVAEHAHRAESHRAAAEADRQRAEQAESGEPAS